MVYLVYAVAWIATSFGACTGLYFTHSAWCLWAFLFPACISLTHKSKDDENEGEEESDGEE